MRLLRRERESASALTEPTPEAARLKSAAVDNTIAQRAPGLRGLDTESAKADLPFQPGEKFTRIIHEEIELLAVRMLV